MSVSFAGEEGSEAYQRLRLGDINYAIYEVSPQNKQELVLRDSGCTEDPMEVLPVVRSKMNPARIQYAAIRVLCGSDVRTRCAKVVLVCWFGEQVPPFQRGVASGLQFAVEALFNSYGALSVNWKVNDADDWDDAGIMQKVERAMGGISVAPPPSGVASGAGVSQQQQQEEKQESEVPRQQEEGKKGEGKEEAEEGEEGARLRREQAAEEERQRQLQLEREAEEEREMLKRAEEEGKEAIAAMERKQEEQKHEEEMEEERRRAEEQQQEEEARKQQEEAERQQQLQQQQEDQQQQQQQQQEAMPEYAPPGEAQEASSSNGSSPSSMERRPSGSALVLEGSPREGQGKHVSFGDKAEVLDDGDEILMQTVDLGQGSIDFQNPLFGLEVSCTPPPGGIPLFQQLDGQGDGEAGVSGASSSSSSSSSSSLPPPVAGGADVHAHPDGVVPAEENEEQQEEAS